MSLHALSPLIARLALAFVIGGAIGFERELHGRPAGLRTHILVCLGACLIALVDAQIAKSSGRIAAQIVTGVGFLGAGTILRAERGSTVHGLTTAASLWCVAGIGIALGFGGAATWLSVAAAAMILLTLTLVNRLEEIAVHRRKNRVLAVHLRSRDESSASTASARLIEQLSGLGVRVRGVSTEAIDENPLNKVVHLTLRIPKGVRSDDVTRRLCDNPEVPQFDWEV